jgi:peptide deformylase
VSLLPIYVLGAPILREETALVDDPSHPELQSLIDDMFETMYAASGIGLAAPQVGRRERLAVVDVEGQTFTLLNPEIVHTEGKERAEEACLSIPEVAGTVERARRVIVRAMDRHGRTFEVEAAGLLGRCLQHEIDHLHGKLFIDHLSYLKRRAALAEWETYREQYPDHLRHLAREVPDRAEHEPEL